MNAQTVRQIVQKRERTDDEWSVGVEECWRELAGALTEDLPWTMEYLKTECSADEFSWISEVWDELVEQTQSIELIVLLRDLFSKFPDDRVKYNYDGNLDVSIGHLRVDEETKKTLMSKPEM